MSKTINIITNQTTHQVTGDRLRTDLMEGGSQDWVALDDYASLIQKEDIEIDENGVYLATEYGGDVIGKVTVKFGDGLGVDGLNMYYGPGTLTGVDPLTGLEATVSLNVDGEIVKVPNVPEGIMVTNLPDQTLYNEGDTIDYTGIVVCAYRSMEGRVPFSNPDWDGPRHNQIPLSELTFPVTTAEMPENEASEVISGHSTVQDMMPFNMYDHVYFKKTSSSSPIYLKAYIYDGGKVACFLNDEIDVMLVVFASKTASKNWFINSYRDQTIDYDDAGALDTTYTYNDQTVYYGLREPGLNSEKSEIIAGGYNFSDRITGDHSIDFQLAKYIAWSMVYGEIESPEINIPVQWQTEYQEEPYEDTFDITVT